MMYFYQVIMCLVIFATIIANYWRLKIDIAKINKDIQSLRVESDKLKEELSFHKKDNRDEMNIFISQNHESHKEIKNNICQVDGKLDKLIQWHLDKK